MNATYTIEPKVGTVESSSIVVIKDFCMGMSATFDFSKIRPNDQEMALMILMRNRNSNP